MTKYSRNLIKFRSRWNIEVSGVSHSWTSAISITSSYGLVEFSYFLTLDKRAPRHVCVWWTGQKEWENHNLVVYGLLLDANWADDFADFSMSLDGLRHFWLDAWWHQPINYWSEPMSIWNDFKPWPNSYVVISHSVPLIKIYKLFYWLAFRFSLWHAAYTDKLLIITFRQ